MKSPKQIAKEGTLVVIIRDNNIYYDETDFKYGKGRGYWTPNPIKTALLPDDIESIWNIAKNQ